MTSRSSLILPQVGTGLFSILEPHGIWTILIKCSYVGTSQSRLDCRLNCSKCTVLHSTNIYHEVWATGLGLHVIQFMSNTNYFLTGAGALVYLVVMGGDSCPECREIESQHWMEIFSHIFVLKNVIFAWKDENKWKKDRDWPIFLKKPIFYVEVAPGVRASRCPTDLTSFPSTKNVPTGFEASAAWCRTDHERPVQSRRVWKLNCQPFRHSDQ